MVFKQQLNEIIRSFGKGNWNEMQYSLKSLKHHEIATLLESSPPKARHFIWQLLDNETENRVLHHLNEEVRAEFLESMDTAELVAAAGDLDTDDFADILQQLPNTITQQVLRSMDAADRARVEAVLSYPEDSAGGLMNTDAITVRPRHLLELVLRYLRRQTDLPEMTDGLIVVNKNDEYVGVLALSKLLTTDPAVTVREVMNTEIEAIPVDMLDSDVAHIFTEQDLVSAPVVDKKGKLVGRITIDDVVDVIIEDADESILARAGLDLDEDTFAPIGKSTGRRAIWLGVNLVTAILAAAVINIFQDTIVKVVALAVLMPIVASMGGIAGTQTLTLVIRGLAMGHIGRANILWFLNREFIVALLNGLLWASLVAIGVAWIFDDAVLGYLIAIAMVMNIVIATLSGSLLPSILTRLGIDPALAGGVILTTITDIAGFFIFLGLASWTYA
ncbi:MAG: magnesium transporter [Pseudomonadales bacterium]|nr:magnesium transporter [Pseudomonadales bacterium]